MEQKTCNKCGKTFNKSLTHFHRRKTSKDGFNTICKLCVKFSKPRSYKHWEDGKLLCLKCGLYKDINYFSKSAKKVHRKYKDIICKECRHIQYENRKIERKVNSTLSRMLTERFCGIKDRVKKHLIQLDFNREYLQELWDKQHGLCAISGIPMTYKAKEGRIYTNVSVDRIDSKLGYTKDNVQLVCMAVNQMKNDLPIDDLIYFCKQIVSNNNEYKYKEIPQGAFYCL